jgi:cytochrome c
MKTIFKVSCATLVSMTGLLVSLSGPAAAAANEDTAKALARQNNCFTCHAIDKKKDGPSWKEVADKYRSNADAANRLVQHLTSGEKAKFPDGHEEAHKIIKTTPANDEAQIRNLVQWLLSLH